MKKEKFVGALLAGVMAVSGIPEVMQPLTTQVFAASKLAAPAKISATVTGTTVKLSWSKVKGADAYRVFVLNSKTNKYDTLKNVSGTSTNIKGLDAGKTYKFKVAALVKSGDSYKVQTASSAKAVKTGLKAPDGITAVVTGSTVTLSWKEVKGADGYCVFSYDSSTKKYTAIKNTTSTTYKVKNLKKGTYSYAVAAIVKNGGKSVVQAMSKAVTAKVTSTASSSSSNGFTFPKFGSSRTAAKKEANLMESIDVDTIPNLAGVSCTCGYIIVAGALCPVYMYFNEKDQFFYGCMLYEAGGLTYSEVLSQVTERNGAASITSSASGIDFTGWIKNKSNAIEFVTGSDKAEYTLHGALTVDYAPESMRNSNKSLVDSLSDLTDILNPAS